MDEYRRRFQEEGPTGLQFLVISSLSQRRFLFRPQPPVRQEILQIVEPTSRWITIEKWSLSVENFALLVRRADG